MSALAADIDLLQLSDDRFVPAWSDMPIEARNALPADVRARCFARYRELGPDVEGSVKRALRAQSHRDADVLRFDRGEPGVHRKPRSADVEGDALASWPPPLDLEDLARREPSAPRFIVPDWLPAGYATGLWGHGGAGKSQVALLLAICLAAGIPFLGLPVERSRVLLLSCEDRAEVLHWRLTRNCAHLGVDLASLRGWLDVLDLVGHESILWAPNPATGRPLTASYGALDARMQSQQTDVLIVDGISDTFGGNEITRAEVKRYVNALLALIPPERGAVLLVGHVDKATARAAATSEGYSGSTAWHNAVRARWHFAHETRDEDGRAERTGDLLLELQKSNLGRADQSIRLRWDETAHVLALKDDTPTGTVATLRTARIQRVLLSAARRLAEMGVRFTDASNSPQYLPRLVVEYKLSEGASKRDLANAMRDAMLDRSLVKGEVGKYENRTPMLGLKVAEGCTK